MSIGISILIFLMSIVALTAEVVLFMLLGFGTAFTGSPHVMFLVFYFVIGLIVATVSIGLLSPICAFIEVLAKQKNIGYRYLAVMVLTILALYNFYTISTILR